MAIITPYKNNTVSSISGTTFTSNGTPFDSSDVGRLIIITDGSGKLQHRKIVSFVSSSVVELDHPFDTNAWLDTVQDVNPSNGDAFVLSYLQNDTEFTNEAGVTVSGEQIDIASLSISGNAYVHIINAQVDLDSAGIEIDTGGGLIFGWYQYIPLEDGQVKDSCSIIDRTGQTTGGNQMAQSDGSFGMLDIYGGTVLRNNGKINFWRCYNNTSPSDCQTRWINVQCFGDAGLGSRTDGNRSIIITEQVGARTTVGVSNPRGAVSRVSISSIDCDQGAYVWLNVSSGGPSGRIIFPRLNNIKSKVIRCATQGHSGTNIMEVIGKKSEIDSAPKFIEASANPGGTHIFRYGNLIKPSFIDSSGSIISENIKTRLYDDSSTFINEEIVSGGKYTELFARHTDIQTLAGDRNLSDGTKYAPYSLRAVEYGKQFTKSVINLEDTYSPNIVMLDDLLITESDKSIVDSYSQIQDTLQAYDSSVSWMEDNITNQSDFLLTRVDEQLKLGSFNVTMNPSFGNNFDLSGNMINIKSASFEGDIETTGTIDLLSIAENRIVKDSTDFRVTNLPTEITLDNSVYVIDSVGTFDLSQWEFLNGASIKVADSTGAVTIVTGGQSITVDNGIGNTVTIDNAINVDITASNIIDGSRVQVYNVTKDAELDNSIVSGGIGYSLTVDLNSANIDNGDTIRLRVAYQSGTTSKVPLSVQGVITTIGLSFIDSQVDLSAYATLGIDGSTVTEYTLDSGNIQIDINDGDGQTQKKRLISRYYYFLTLEDGIRYFYDAMELEDSGNAVINRNVTTLMLDNVSSQQLQFTDSDFRLYTSDGSNWILPTSTGGYGINNDNGKVYIAEPSGADYTVQDIVDGVWDEPLTGATHNDPTSAGRRLRQASAWLSVEGEVIGTPTTTSIQTDITQTQSSFYADQTFVFTSGVLAGQARIISSYNGTTKTFTFDEPWVFAPSATDEFAVFANHEHSIGQIQNGLATTTQLNAQTTSIKGVDDRDNTEVYDEISNSGLDQATFDTRMLNVPEGTKDTYRATIPFGLNDGMKKLLLMIREELKEDRQTTKEKLEGILKNVDNIDIESIITSIKEKTISREDVTLLLKEYLSKEDISSIVKNELKNKDIEDAERDLILKLEAEILDQHLIRKMEEEIETEQLLTKLFK